jgi:hypothetical protein
MTDGDYWTPALSGPGVVESCWLCGIRLSAGKMMADGGGACADVRWYCLDTRACTERWTTRWAGSADFQPGPAGLPRRQATGLERAAARTARVAQVS